MWENVIDKTGKVVDKVLNFTNLEEFLKEWNVYE